jgi:hypothetical protein
MKTLCVLIALITLAVSAYGYESETEFLFRCDPSAAQLTLIEASLADQGLFHASGSMPRDVIVNPENLTKSTESKGETYRETARRAEYRCTLGSARYQIVVAPHIFNSRTSGPCGAASPSISITVSRNGQRIVRNVPFQRDCHDERVLDALRFDERAQSLTLFSGLRVVERQIEKAFPLAALPPDWFSVFFDAWPSSNPNADLRHGVRTHDFALVSRALDSGADIIFHAPNDVGVLGEVAYGRLEASRLNRLAEFDEETDRLVTLLLARGAPPTISTQNGGTAIDVLATSRVPNRTIRALLDAGWPRDYHYRLYVGVLLGDPVLVLEALEHGADPNKEIRGGRYLDAALLRPCVLSAIGEEAEQEQALVSLEVLLRRGARLDEGTATRGGGDIVRTFANWGNRPNIRQVLDVLIRYSAPAARANSLYWLRIRGANPHPQIQANLEWLRKRLEQ